MLFIGCPWVRERKKSTNEKSLRSRESLCSQGCPAPSVQHHNTYDLGSFGGMGSAADENPTMAAVMSMVVIMVYRCTRPTGLSFRLILLRTGCQFGVKIQKLLLLSAVRQGVSHGTCPPDFDLVPLVDSCCCFTHLTTTFLSLAPPNTLLRWLGISRPLHSG